MVDIYRHMIISNRKALKIMNLLILTSVYPQPDELASTPTVEYYCKEWSKQGHRIIVIHNSTRFIRLLYHIPKSICDYAASKLDHPMPTKATAVFLKREEDGVTIYRLPIFKLLPYKKFSERTLRKQFDSICTILEENECVPDLIIGHWVNPQVLLLPMLKERFHAKTSIVFHNDCSDKAVQMLDLKNVITKIDAVGCRSITYAHLVQSKLKLKKEPFVCYSGVPDELVQNNKEGVNSRNQYIYVGRLVSYKNVDAIIKALNKAYKDSEYCFHIIGEGYERDNLETLAQSLGCKEKVVFHGTKSREEVFDLLSNCGCFIMISNNETFGMVYVEAMLKGCITVGSKGGGIDGVIKDGINGFLCKQGDSEELAKVIEKIRKLNDSEINIIRNNAIETASNMSDSNVARKYLEDVIAY